MIFRTFQAHALNAVANHAEVRPWLGGGEGPADLTALISNRANITLETAGGGIIFCKISDGLYEAHSLFLPRARGPHAAEVLAEALRYMFTATDAIELVTRVPIDNKAADGFARLAGGREIFTLAHDPIYGGVVTFRSLTLDAWIGRDEACRVEGAKFHNTLRAADVHDDHPDEPAHDRVVGAAVLMARAHQIGKAAWTYNRWAALAGYGAIKIVSTAPLVIDMGTAQVAMLDGRVEVLPCPSSQQ